MDGNRAIRPVKKLGLESGQWFKGNNQIAQEEEGEEVCFVEVISSVENRDTPWVHVFFSMFPVSFPSIHELMSVKC